MIIVHPTIPRQFERLSFCEEFFQEPKPCRCKDVGCDVASEGAVPAVSVSVLYQVFKVLLVGEQMSLILLHQCF